MVEDRYAARGVSASKKEVHDAVDGMDRGLFPFAFCKVTPDFLGHSDEYCNVIHADGCGTKSIIAYLKYRETGSVESFSGLAQDNLVMNLDDLLCSGVTGGLVFSSTINRNPRNISGEIIGRVIRSTEELIEKFNQWGIDIKGGGGETADVPDLTQTMLFDGCLVARLKREEILAKPIEPGLVIVGLASDGQAEWEDQVNSGIASNGLTSARHDILNHYYGQKYPETYDNITASDLVYCGPYKLEDELPESEGMSVGEALLSPTRSYAPLMAPMIREHREKIHALIHCTGGAQTKCLRFGKQVHFIKDQLFNPPPIFRAIQKASQAGPKEMYRVFNMGHRLEIYCQAEHANFFIDQAQSKGIQAKVIGRTEASQKDQGNHLTLTDPKTAEVVEYGL